jgi:hypothetical protein
MTLQIKSTDMILGTPLKPMREFVRHLASWHQHSFDCAVLKEHLSLDEESAQSVLSELESQVLYQDGRERRV